MTPVRTLTLALLVVASSAFAQFPAPQIFVDPVDPTSNDDVTLLVQQVASCPPPPTVIRTGSEINVTLGAGPCLFPPGLITHSIDLGKLSPGRYNVTVVEPGSSVPRQFSFAVLDANSTVTVSQSIGSTAGGTTVNITVAAAHCLNKPPTSCPPPTITFDGIPATNIVVIDQSHFRATTPPHAPGAVQVVVSDTTFTKSSYAFRYYDPSAAPSDKFFEKILIPVIFNGPGALGSNWVTELSIRNDNGFAVEPWRPIAGSSSIASLKPMRFGSGDAPGGLFLIVPRESASSLFVHAAVRDTSRADSEWATEIPVVREHDFANTTIELLDVPVDSRFRTMVRIYTAINPLPAYATFAHLSFYAMDDGHGLGDTFVTLNSCSTDSCAEHPSFASVADATHGLPSGRVGIQIQTNMPVWAFATVTNNETQHVTVISPR